MKEQAAERTIGTMIVGIAQAQRMRATSGQFTEEKSYAIKQRANGMIEILRTLQAHVPGLTQSTPSELKRALRLYDEEMKKENPFHGSNLSESSNTDRLIDFIYKIAHDDNMPDGVRSEALEFLGIWDGKQISILKYIVEKLDLDAIL
jgi:hypothetical protein